MMKKFYSLFIALLIVCSLFAQNKKLVFLGTTLVDTKDAQVIAGITAHGGYDITEIVVDVATEAILSDCNAADVVIIGRSINSSNMGSAMAIYDQITTPTMCMNMWGMRNLSDRAQWTPSTTCENINDGLIQADNVLQANILVDDAVFAGQTGTINWWNSYYSAFGPDAEGDDAGNGVLLAETADKRPLFIRWSAGVEFFPGCGHSPAGERSFIGCGQDNVSTAVTYFTFTDNALTIFFNELARLASAGSGSNVPEMNDNKPNLTVFANQSEISVNMQNLSRVEIYSISGKLMLSSNANENNIKLNSNLQKGIYIAKATSSNGLSTTEKFIVK